MKKIISLFFVSLLCFSKVQSQDNYFKPLFSAILDTPQAPIILHQCSRSVPHKIKSYWIPAQTEVNSLQNNFKKIYLSSIKVDSLDKFGFQYLGVEIEGKKYIYINAFPIREVEVLKKENYDPSQKAVVVCDGGRYFWGVLFDIETMGFSLLAFNGRG